MPNTTNFNWATPADTDLVKDGAAAIRTLGNSIDSSFVDLKGGTTGQILSKASNTDLDFTFITPNVGDITEVQAGAGISVASGTGPIPVITNTVATAFDAAGDLVYGTGADTFAKLGIGTAGQVLKVNSGATAPEWSSAAASFSGALAYNNANTTISNNSEAFFTYNSETYDTDGYHSTSSNTGRLTIPTGKSGYYFVYALARFAANANGVRTMQLTQGASQTSIAVMEQTPGGVSSNTALYAATIRYAAAGDYFETKIYQTSGGNLDVLSGDNANYMGIQYVGA